VQTLAGPIEDPCTGPHARSIRNCLQSAFSVANWFVEQAIANTTFSDAAWHSWLYGLSAGFVLGGLAAYRPRAVAASSASLTMERITRIFELGAAKGVGGAVSGLVRVSRPRAFCALTHIQPALERLRTKVRAAARTGLPIPWDGDADEFLIFGGRAKVLSAKKKPTVAGPSTLPAELHHEFYPIMAGASAADVVKDDRLAAAADHDMSLPSASRQQPSQLRIPADAEASDISCTHSGYIDILATTSSRASAYEDSNAALGSALAKPTHLLRMDSSLLDPYNQSGASYSQHNLSRDPNVTYGTSQGYALSASTSPNDLKSSAPVLESTAYAFAPPTLPGSGERLTPLLHSSSCTGSPSAHSFYAATPLLDSTTYSFPLSASAVPSHASPRTSGGSGSTQPTTPYEHGGHHASSAATLESAGAFDYETLGYYAAPFPGSDQHIPSRAEHTNFTGSASSEWPGVIPGFGCPVAAASCDTSEEDLLRASAGCHGRESPSVPPLAEAYTTPYYATPPHTTSHDYTSRGSMHATQSAISGQPATATSMATASAPAYPFAYGLGIPSMASGQPDVSTLAFMVSPGDHPFAYTADADLYPPNDTDATDAYSAALHAHSARSYAPSQAVRAYHFPAHQTLEPRNAYPRDYPSTSR
jgi:hypothetical protein